MSLYYDFIIVGGGIAGVVCCETLATLNGRSSILMITASPAIKQIINVKPVTKLCEQFDVDETSFSSLSDRFNNVTIIQNYVKKLIPNQHALVTDDDVEYKYKKICICAGGRPKVICEKSDYVIGIRDTVSASEFAKRLKNARKIVIVGNGGLSTELVYEIKNCSIVWVVRDEYASHVFFDAVASDFLLKRIKETNDKDSQTHSRRQKYVIERSNATYSVPLSSGALGPYWFIGLDLEGQTGRKNVIIECNCEVENVYVASDFDAVGFQDEEHWPCCVKLSNGKFYGCDFVISATGVIPNIDPFIASNDIAASTENGLIVDEEMRASVPDVYAAGDVCWCNWNFAKDWFQMRLWTQARQLGQYAAKCMLAHENNETIMTDFCFELFEHCTYFFGYKVILLGRYNAQGLGDNYELLYRRTEGVELIKLVISEGKIRGAVLIGDTELAETIENLMLSEIDVSAYGDDLLNPDIDITDYFD